MTRAGAKVSDRYGRTLTPSSAGSRTVRTTSNWEAIESATLAQLLACKMSALRRSHRKSYRHARCKSCQAVRRQQPISTSRTRAPRTTSPLHVSAITCSICSRRGSSQEPASSWLRQSALSVHFVRHPAHTAAASTSATTRLAHRCSILRSAPSIASSLTARNTTTPIK